MRRCAPGQAGHWPARVCWQLLLAAWAAALLALSPHANAGSLPLCDAPLARAPLEQARSLAFAALVQRTLAPLRAPQSAVLVSRAGLRLERLGIRYSHMGVWLPGTVRQLYYACEDRAPHLYDQGLAGFVFGSADATGAWLSVVVPPEPAARALAQAVGNDQRSLQLLGARYSANAHAFATRYQNCNQWVAEMLALAWRDAPAGSDPAGEGAPHPTAARAQAQAWLREQGYTPATVAIGFRPWLWLMPFIPWVHGDDHPDDDLAAARFRVSLPAAIESFVHETSPDAERIEFCHDGAQAVVHRGWTPLGARCEASEGDRQVDLDAADDDPQTLDPNTPETSP